MTARATGSAQIRVARGLLNGGRMKLAAAALLAALAACTSNSDPYLGSATLTHNGGTPFQAAAWLERDYSWFADTKAVVVYSVTFTTDPAANTATCKSRAALTQLERIDLDSTHVFDQSNPSTVPDIETGTYQVVSELDVPQGPPPMTIATFNDATQLTSGTVTISTSDGQGITGSFSASGGSPLLTMSGTFEAPICDLGVGM